MEDTFISAELSTFWQYLLKKGKTYILLIFQVKTVCTIISKEKPQDFIGISLSLSKVGNAVIPFSIESQMFTLITKSRRNYKEKGRFSEIVFTELSFREKNGYISQPFMH